MLTKEQSDQLKDYFPAQAHEFLQGNTYLSEEAITNRLDDIDPSWEFHRLGDFAYRDNSIIATFRLTVSGVSRDGIGMWDLTIKKKDGNLMPAVDPEKSVSTDALKRAARLFGIGRYILEMKGVNDYRTLENWLATRRGINKETGEIKLVQNAHKTHQDAILDELAQASGDFEQSPQSSVKTPAQRLGTPSGQRIGQDATKGIEMIAVRATVKNTKNNKPYLLLESDSGQKVSLFTRDPLRDAGYECEDWTEMDKTYAINPPAAVTAKQDGKFLNFESLIKADAAVIPF